MDAVLAVFSGLGPLIQIIIALGALVIFWKPIAQQIGWHEKEEPEESILGQLLLQMQTLSNHYNHDTTDLLTSLDSSMKKIADSLERMNRVQEKLLEEHGESAELIKQFEKFGVKVRDCDVK